MISKQVFNYKEFIKFRNKILQHIALLFIRVNLLKIKNKLYSAIKKALIISGFS